MKWQMLLVVGAGSLIAADAKEGAKKDTEAIQGKWEVVAATYGGKVSDLKGDPSWVWTISATQIAYDGDKADDYKVDPEKKPKELDAVRIRKGEKDAKLLGIYELTGDELKICIAPAEQGRPSEFTSKAGSGQNLVVLKRVK